MRRLLIDGTADAGRFGAAECSGSSDDSVRTPACVVTSTGTGAVMPARARGGDGRHLQILRCPLHEAFYEDMVLSVEKVVRGLVAGGRGRHLGYGLSESDRRIREVLGQRRFANALEKVTRECVSASVERIMQKIASKGSCRVLRQSLPPALGDSTLRPAGTIAEALTVGRSAGLGDRCDSGRSRSSFQLRGVAFGLSVCEHGLHLGKRQSQPVL